MPLQVSRVEDTYVQGLSENSFLSFFSFFFIHIEANEYIIWISIEKNEYITTEPNYWQNPHIKEFYSY